MWFSHAFKNLFTEVYAVVQNGEQKKERETDIRNRYWILKMRETLEVLGFACCECVTSTHK